MWLVVDTKEGTTFGAVGTAVGTVRVDEVIQRTGTISKDLVAVTLTRGRRWGARWAYQLVKTFEFEVDPSVVAYLQGADSDFRLPYAESRALAAGKLATAGLDLSDGIGASLNILASHNDLGFDLYPSALDQLVDPMAASGCGYVGHTPSCDGFVTPAICGKIYTRFLVRIANSHRGPVAESGGELVVIGEAQQVDLGVSYGGKKSAVLTAASDEKFESGPGRTALGIGCPS